MQVIGHLFCQIRQPVFVVALFKAQYRYAARFIIFHGIAQNKIPHELAFGGAWLSDGQIENVRIPIKVRLNLWCQCIHDV